ncbi:hypothetical protein [Austwickia chelonae]|uniref:hypothetical protein n=1 Tax=Austwickia chelonae TaxID=100225 RepID=UPI0013C3522A|nr:hypothetical protein [Austwickia chelonae]
MTDEIFGSAAQLVINIAGMLVGGIATLWVERVTGDRLHLRPDAKIAAWVSGLRRPR